MTISRLIPGFGIFLSMALCQAPPTLTVEGIGGKSVVLSAADLAKLPRKTFTASVHGSPAAFEGVLLSDVLGKAEMPAGEKFQGTAASYYVVVEAKDAYRAVFAWAELDATVAERPVYLVTKKDGKALSEKDGPFETIVPGEKRDSRWVRQVTALKVKKAN